MKLSKLVAYRNKLDTMTPIDSAPLVHDKLAPLLHEIKTSEFQAIDHVEQLEKNYNQILNSISDFEESIENIKESINDTVQQLELSYYQNSQVLYNQMFDLESSEYILNRRLNLTDDARQFLTARIQMHGDWRYPGMIVRPGREDWIDMLVGCDPMYLVDNTTELLEPAVLRFNDQYQRRLRTYTADENQEEFLINKLPQNQFAFCLIYYFFNFKTEAVVRRYLQELFLLLKPGGTIGFTFNNCDRQGGVDLTERSFAMYTPGKEIFRFLIELGFEIKQKYNIDAANTWVEAQKPGILTSIRGGQSLAKILPRL